MLLVLACMYISSVLLSQDAVFSQYFASGVYFNPALAATETSLTISGITRVQWKSINSSFNTSMLALTVPVKDKFEKHKRLAGATLSYYDDKSSDNILHTQGLNAAFSYGFMFSEKNILFLGGQVGWFTTRVDTDQFIWGSDLASLVLPSDFDSQLELLSNSSYIDVSAGFLAVHDLKKKVGTDRSEIYFGGAFYHLNRPNQSIVKEDISNLPLRMNYNLGAIFPLRENIGVSPNFLFVQQGQKNQFNTGVYFSYYFLNQEGEGFVPNNIELGSWYRFGDSFIFNIGLGNEVYHLGFSYDLTTSNLKYTSGGNNAYEISFKIQKPHKKSERHYTPRF